ncbi:hypothetical protein DL769_005472 [Monosporascus sp. CRB-8-3]|nr:hypothetical protein DL769_005472 [Monosporascus sp. CRB-8-3]
MDPNHSQMFYDTDYEKDKVVLIHQRRIGVEISSLSRYSRATTPSCAFDFGVEIGGVIYVNYTLSGSPAALGLAFTDSKIRIGQRSDNSNGATDPDLTLHRKIDATGPGTYAVPDKKQRGNFR